jgi:hypothetical protein
MGAVLLGSAVVPGPGDPEAVGWARVTRGSASNVICYLLAITRGSPTTALLARGAPGEAGTKLADLIGPTVGHDSFGCEAFDAAAVSDLLTDRAAGAEQYFITLGDVNGPLVRGPLIPGSAPSAVELRAASGEATMTGRVTWSIAGPGPEAARLSTFVVSGGDSAIRRAVVRRGAPCAPGRLVGAIGIDNQMRDATGFTVSELADLVARPDLFLLEVTDAAGTVSRGPIWRVDLGRPRSRGCDALPDSATAPAPAPWLPLTALCLLGLVGVIGRVRMRARTIS